MPWVSACCWWYICVNSNTLSLTCPLYDQQNVFTTGPLSEYVWPVTVTSQIYVGLGGITFSGSVSWAQCSNIIRILELYLNVHLWAKNVFNWQTLIFFFFLYYISYLAANLLFNWPFERQLPPLCTWSWRGSLFQDNTHLSLFSKRSMHHPSPGLCTFHPVFPSRPSQDQICPLRFFSHQPTPSSTLLP